MTDLFERLARPDAREALRIDDVGWTYEELSGAANAHARSMRDRGVAEGDLIGVYAHPSVTTVSAVLGNMSIGAVTVLLSPKLAAPELAHILGDASPRLVFSDSGYPMPPALSATDIVSDRYERDRGTGTGIGVDAQPALILYTSGTTGAPKGAMITRANIAANLDALALAWAWTEQDTVVHALPMIHVHGLVLGLFGSLRAGGSLRHLSRFSAAGIADALAELPSGRSILFAVPTMYHRLADAAESNPAVAVALARPRLLISGSAGLPVREHERIEAISGRGIHERYGLTETLINCAVPANQPPMPGYVGPALAGVELLLVDEERRPIDSHDDKTIGEIAVRGDSVFAGYLNRPEATAAVRDPSGWFYTGDLATRTETGSIRILGRRSTDLIKTGGYRVGAGEIEACLLEHPSCAEVAVVGVPDEDLGQRIIAFVVARTAGDQPDPADLIDFAAAHLSPHKRPREVRIVPELPRNAMGKVQKKRLLQP
ncbi:MAG: AMP-binding protein [Myxococcota bacterium]